MTDPILRPTTGADNPFKGPHPLEVKDPIFGRDCEISALQRQLISDRIVLLHSTSGCGKSSLVEAGLRKHLPSEFEQTIHTIRLKKLLSDQKLRGGDFVEAVTKELEFKTEGLHFAFFDQFEEVLTAREITSDHRLRFFKRLGIALDNRRLWVILAVRDDYVGGLQGYLRMLPTRLSSRFPLGPLSIKSAEEAMQRTCEGSGVYFGPEAATALASRLSYEGTEGAKVVEPVHLQVVCRHIWDTVVKESKTIGVSALGENISDSVNDALGQYYADCTSGVSTEFDITEHSLREWFEKDLINPYGYRAQVTQGPLHDAERDKSIVYELQNRYLVRIDIRIDTEWYELAHDRMILPIRLSNKEWRAENYTEFQRAAEDWDREGRPMHKLLVGRSLIVGKTWAMNQKSMSQVERDFLHASQQVAATRFWQFASAIFIGAILCLLGVLIWNNRKSQYEKQISLSHELSQTALTNIYMNTPDPERSMLLALQAAMEVRSNSKFMPADVTESLNAASDASRIRTLIRSDSPAISIAFSPDDEHFAVKSAAGALKIFDVNSGEATFDLVTDPKSTTGLSGDTVALSRDAVAAVGDSGTVTIWHTNPVDTTPWSRLETSAGSVTSLAFNKRGDQLVIAGSKTAELWNIEGIPTHYRTLRDSAGMSNIRFSPQGDLIVGISRQAITIWNSADVTIKQRIQSTDGALTAVAINHDGSYIAAGTNKGVALLRGPRFAWPETLLFGKSDEVSALSYDRDGHYLAAAGNSGRVVVWSILQNRTRTFTALGKGAPIRDEAIEPTYNVVFRLDGHSDKVYSVAFSPDGRRIGTASKDHTARIWTTDGSNLQAADISQLSRDGSLLAQVQADEVVLWDLGSRRQIGHFQCQACISVAFSYDNRRMATCNNGGVDVWNIVTNTAMYTLPNAAYSWTAALNHDASKIAVVGIDGVRVWDVSLNRWIYKSPLAENKANAVAISPSGQYVAFGGYQKTATIIDLESHPVSVASSISLSSPVEKIAINGKTANSSTIVGIATSDGTVNLRDTAGKVINNMVVSIPGHEITALAISSDGLLVAASSEDGAVVRTVAEPSEEFRTSSRYVTSLVFNYDNSGVIAVSQDGRVMSFITAPSTLFDIARSRVTRTLSLDECQHYLHEKECPTSISSLEDLIQAEKLSKGSKFSEAVLMFTSAKKKDKELNLDPSKAARKTRATMLVEKSEMLLSELRDDATDETDIDSKVNAASSAIREAQGNIDPPLREELAHQALNSGQRLAQRGAISAALKLYGVAEFIHPPLFDASNNSNVVFLNNLCWFGTLWWHAKEVFPYCSRAVTLSPEITNFRDSRGLASACLGNTDSAIRDFQAYMASNESPRTDKDDRQKWINSIERGESVCTERILASLRNAN